MDDTFYCGGSSVIGGYTIHCQKRTGHGTQTLTQAVENSCNCALMEIAQRMGAETFWRYLEDYGLFDKTGIDLAGEGTSVFWAAARNTSPAPMACPLWPPPPSAKPSRSLPSA